MGHLTRRAWRILRRKTSAGTGEGSPVGRWGRITNHGAITHDRIGEVSVPIGTGVEYYYAKSDDGQPIGAKEEVVVVDYVPPRTVIVARAEGREGEGG